MRGECWLKLSVETQRSREVHVPYNENGLQRELQASIESGLFKVESRLLAGRAARPAQHMDGTCGARHELTSIKAIYGFLRMADGRSTCHMPTRALKREHSLIHFVSLACHCCAAAFLGVNTSAASCSQSGSGSWLMRTCLDRGFDLLSPSRD